MNQETVDDTEDGSRRAKSKRDGEKRNRRPARSANERSRGELGVGPDAVEQVRLSLHPLSFFADDQALFAGGGEVAEAVERGDACRVSSQSACDVLARQHVDVKVELVVHVLGDVGAPEAEVAAPSWSVATRRH